jgi:hypothetical protein
MTIHDEDPGKMMERSDSLRDEALALEKEAIRKAAGLASGNLAHAAAILGRSPGVLARAIEQRGGRHKELWKAFSHTRGRPPLKLEVIQKRATKLPKGLPPLLPATTKGKAKAPAKVAKPAPKAAKAAAAPLAKLTEAQWTDVIEAWIEVRANGGNQKEFAAKHGVGVSTLRERTAAYTAAMKAPAAPAVADDPVM